MQARNPSLTQADYQISTAPSAAASGNEVLLLQVLDCARESDCSRGIDVAQKLTRQGSTARIERGHQRTPRKFRAIRAATASSQACPMAYHLFCRRGPGSPTTAREKFFGAIKGPFKNKPPKPEKTP